MLAKYGDKIHTLRFRILGSIFLVFAFSLSVALFGMWTAQRSKVVAMAQEEAMQAGLTIKAGLHVSMLQNDRSAIKKTISVMAEAGNISRISVLDLGGMVKLSSDAALQGRVYDRNRAAACVECHRRSGETPPLAFRVVDEAGEPVLRNVLKIENRAECHRCHDPAQELCGILMVDSSLATAYESLNRTAVQVVVTGLVTFLVIALLVSFLIAKFVTNPLQAMVQGFQQVGGGDFDYWVEVKGSDEIVEISDSFNIMSRAVGRYIKEIASKSDEISTLYTIVQRMSETIDGQKLKHIVIDLLLEIFKAKTVVLILPVDSAVGRYEVFWGEGGARRHHRAEYELSAGGDPHPDVSRTALAAWQEQTLDQPVLGAGESKALISIHLQDMRFALLCIVKGGEHPFAGAEKKLFPAVVHHIAISFANARLYTMAITDELTGLYTKRYLHSVAKELLVKADKEKGPGLCLLMLDIDHFKDVNDRHGHLTGDRVLRQVAEVIRTSLRTADIPCRYGGEEFVVFLPDTDQQTGVKVAERLRMAVAQHSFLGAEDLILRKTISIGLACAAGRSGSLEELLSRADAALYDAKQHGRNQVKAWTASGDASAIGG
ncbi:diguanylate cyclase [Thiovibrio sp. JS02]